jgi:hypothetical protein
MAQHEGARAEEVVDVLAAGHIDEPGPARLAHHEGQVARHRVAPEDAAGQEADGFLEECFLF